MDGEVSTTSDGMPPPAWKDRRRRQERVLRDASHPRGCRPYRYT